MDPAADPTPPAAPPAPALAKGEPDGGVASAVAAPPDPPLPPRLPWLARLSPRARSVLRIVLATLALGWCTQYAMRRHFDAGPYTGPLYYFESASPNGPTYGLMDDTGRIVVPAGNYETPQRIGGWRSTWIFEGKRWRLAWSKSRPFLSLRTVPAPPVIMQAGAASRPLGIDAPEVPYLIDSSMFVPESSGPRAYRLPHNPELLELYLKQAAGNIDGRLPELSMVMNRVRLTDGPTLLRGTPIFRLSLSPPTYLVCDGAGSTVQRWDGEGFVQVATYMGPVPASVSVLNAAPLTLQFYYPSHTVLRNAEGKKDGFVSLHQVVGDRVVSLGHYLSIQTLDSRWPPRTSLVSEVNGTAIPDPAMDYLVAEKWLAKDGNQDTAFDAFLGPSLLMRRDGKELFDGKPTRVSGSNAHFIYAASFEKGGGGHLLVRATGKVIACKGVILTQPAALAITRHDDGTWRVIDPKGNGVGDPNWEYVNYTRRSPGMLIVQLDGKRGVWSPDEGYLLPPRYTYVDDLGDGIFAVSESGRLANSNRDDYSGLDTWRRSTTAFEPVEHFSNYGVLDTHGRWIQPIGPGEVETIYFRGTPSGYARSTPQEIRIYDHDWQLLFTLPGDWRVRVNRIADNLFELRSTARPPLVESIRAFFHADGSAAPDFGEGQVRALDGTCLAIQDPKSGSSSLRTADGGWPLGTARYREINWRTDSRLIDLHLLPVPVEDGSIEDNLHQLYDAATGALSPIFSYMHYTADRAGRPIVNLMDPSVAPSSGIVFLGEDLQPLPSFRGTHYKYIQRISEVITGRFDRSPVGLVPGAGSWKSAGLYAVRDNKAGSSWTLLKPDGQLLAPSINGSALPYNITIVDARFLHLTSGTNSILVDRFGHIVTPHN